MDDTISLLKKIFAFMAVDDERTIKTKKRKNFKDDDQKDENPKSFSLNSEKIQFAKPTAFEMIDEDDIKVDIIENLKETELSDIHTTISDYIKFALYKKT
jgi:hypothetical protein